MKVNTELLKDKIKRKGLLISDFAKAIGVNSSTIYRKMNSDGESFTVGEMHKTGEVLNLTSSELCDIFLFDNSQKCEKGQLERAEEASA